MPTRGYIKKTINVDNRNFLLQSISYDNGNFISISEGNQKLGSMVVSIGSGPTTTSATVIPAKTNFLFLKLTAEKISTSIKGISIVSLFTTKEIGIDASKILMREILEMIKAD